MGLDPQLFWSVTPGEVAVISQGIQEKFLREQRERAWVVYHTEALHRTKKLPKLEKLFPRKTKRRRTWQEQMAVMDQWAAVMNARSAKGLE